MKKKVLPKKKSDPKKTEKKSGAKYPRNNGRFTKGNNEGIPFPKGNKLAERWPKEAVLPLIAKVWGTITAGVDDAEGNYVRSNDIKLLGEVRIMHGITKQQWSEWKEKFKDDHEVSDLIDKIEESIECRLIYSGGRMDEFVLRNKYGYVDRQEIDHSNKGEKFESPKDLSSYSAKDLNTILQAKKLLGENESTG